jgi:phosphatidylinositol glycan class P protein
MSQKSDGRSRKQNSSFSRHAAAAARDQDYNSFETETGSQPFPPLESEHPIQPSSQGQTTGDGDLLKNSDYQEEGSSQNDGFSRMSDNVQAEAGIAAEVEVEVEVEDDADFQSQYSLENENASSGEGDGESISGGSEYGLHDPDQEEEDDDEEEVDEDDDNRVTTQGNHDDNNIAMHRHFMQSTGSLHGPNNAFAPPFYNRPPTPLPPSPSLTSLLRPPFSTTTSRPTTPDTSDAETPNDTEAVVAKSARHATTVPRASPKVPTYEYYGFVLYLASSFAFRK